MLEGESILSLCSVKAYGGYPGSTHECICLQTVLVFKFKICLLITYIILIVNTATVEYISRSTRYIHCPTSNRRSRLHLQVVDNYNKTDGQRYQIMLHPNDIPAMFQTCHGRQGCYITDAADESAQLYSTTLYLSCSYVYNMGMYMEYEQFIYGYQHLFCINN